MRHTARKKGAGAAAWLVCALLSASAAPGVHRQTLPNDRFEFVVATDSTGPYARFAPAPAINRDGAVAFVAQRGAGAAGAVLRWDRGRVVTIATTEDGVFRDYGDQV